ncbi:MAG TPA: sulfite exporter TauE/SafE family protein [Gaiellales bacterium]|nr:sulfite exporter TauE/SafE family protein [Gaiellales bacterium]
MTGVELVVAGLIVGVLIGATGMGAGSLMAPVLISVFGVSAVSAVATDLLYSSGTKLVGGFRHYKLGTANTELARWMAIGSVPAAIAGVFTLHLMASARGTAIDATLKRAIAVALILVAVAVVVRTFFTIRALWTHSIPRDGELTRRHRVLAVVVGVVLGYVFGFTSVGAGAFFGMALILLFPLSTRRIVGTDLFHGAIVTVAAAVAALFWLPMMHFESIGLLMVGSIPGILVGSQLMLKLPEKALRSSLASVLMLSGLKLLNVY